MNYVLLLLLIYPAFSFSQGVKTITQEYTDEALNLTDDLLSFKMSINDVKRNETVSKGHKAGKYTSAIFSYTTKETSKEALGKYAVVQYIKGCDTYSYHFPAEQNRQDEVGYSTRDFWGDDNYTFHHPNWVLDSIDTNPIYGSHREGNYDSDFNLHFFFHPLDPTLSPHERDSGNKQDLTFFEEAEVAPSSTLYVNDLPTVATIDSATYDFTSSRSVFLELRTCIHKRDEIPRYLENPDPSLIKSKPLHCFNWQVKHAWSEEKEDFITPEMSVEEFCKL